MSLTHRGAPPIPFPSGSQRRSTRSPGCRRPAKDELASTPSVIARRPGAIPRENGIVSYGSSTSVHKTGSPGSTGLRERPPRRIPNSAAGTFRTPAPEAGMLFLARLPSRNVSPAAIWVAATTTSTGFDRSRISFSTAAIRRLATASAIPASMAPRTRGIPSRNLPPGFAEKKERVFRLIEANNVRLPSISFFQQPRRSGCTSLSGTLPSVCDEPVPDRRSPAVDSPEDEIDRSGGGVEPEGVFRGQPLGKRRCASGRQSLHADESALKCRMFPRVDCRDPGLRRILHAELFKLPSYGREVVLPGVPREERPPVDGHDPGGRRSGTRRIASHGRKSDQQQEGYAGACGKEGFSFHRNAPAIRAVRMTRRTFLPERESFPQHSTAASRFARNSWRGSTRQPPMASFRWETSTADTVRPASPEKGGTPCARDWSRADTVTPSPPGSTDTARFVEISACNRPVRRTWACAADVAAPSSESWRNPQCPPARRTRRTGSTMAVSTRDCPPERRRRFTACSSGSGGISRSSPWTCRRTALLPQWTGIAGSRPRRKTGWAARTVPGDR